MGWDMAAPLPTTGTTSSLLREKGKIQLGNPVPPGNSLRSFHQQIFWKAVASDYEELQSEQEKHLNSRSAVHDTSILSTFAFKSTI